MKSGDHIYIYLRYKGYKYTHHGIYIGDNRVIHYWNGKIRRSKLYKKSNKWYGKTIHIKKHKYHYPSERVVKRAKKRLDEKKYHLLFNNCQHFAYWCKVGKHKSEQVEEAPLKAFKYATKKFEEQVRKQAEKKKKEAKEQAEKAEEQIKQYIREGTKYFR